MSKVKGAYQPRIIDRVVYAALAVVCIISGGYAVGPWYLEVDESGAPAPTIASLFNNPELVNIFGFMVIVVGFGLLYGAFAKAPNRRYTHILSYSLLLAFLLRLYSLIGAIVVLESWKPPNFINPAALVVVLGGYWLWVKVNDRPTQ